MRKFYTNVFLLACGVLFSTALQAQTTYSYTGSTDSYVVPSGVVSISIEAKGSKGQDGTSVSGGNGATMYGEFTVSPGDVLTVYAGGNTGYKRGGDGSWVENTTTGTLLIVAGGGGAGTHSKIGGGAPVTEDGTTNPSHVGYSDGTPGTGGNGGGAGTGAWGTGGGGGWFSAGADGSGSPGGAMPCMGSEGTTYAGGAGGGYSGGGGVDMASGWGTGGGGAGGSYNIGTAQANIAADNAAEGEITITELCTGLTYTVSDDTVCVGDEVTLDATSTLGGTITWDGGVTNGTPFTPPAGSTTYNATSSDAGDCGLSVTIFVGDYPTVDAGSDVTFCSGDEVTLTASGTATDWSWDGGITDGVPFSPSGTTTYTLTGMIDSTGCEATDDVEVAEVIIDNTVSATGSDLVANQAGADGYQWLDCSDMSPVSGETSQTYVSVPDGDYAVEITLDGCKDTSDCQLVHVGIEEFYQEVLLYPNPTTGKFTVTVEGTYSYEVTNVLGKTIFNGTAVGVKEFDLSDFADGAYFVKVVNADELRTIKVVKK